MALINQECILYIGVQGEYHCPSAFELCLLYVARIDLQEEWTTIRDTPLSIRRKGELEGRRQSAFTESPRNPGDFSAFHWLRRSPPQLCVR